jgi:hypothetical protein
MSAPNNMTAFQKKSTYNPPCAQVLVRDFCDFHQKLSSVYQDFFMQNLFWMYAFCFVVAQFLVLEKPAVL